MRRKVHGRLNGSWKISCLAVNGQSFLVIWWKSVYSHLVGLYVLQHILPVQTLVGISVFSRICYWMAIDGLLMLTVWTKDYRISSEPLHHSLHEDHHWHKLLEALTSLLAGKVSLVTIRHSEPAVISTS